MPLTRLLLQPYTHTHTHKGTHTNTHTHVPSLHLTNLPQSRGTESSNILNYYLII
jgi:hypothetical protein